jgi:hypothetical protein
MQYSPTHLLRALQQLREGGVLRLLLVLSLAPL